MCTNILPRHPLGLTPLRNSAAGVVLCTQYMDTVWHARVPCSGDYSEQGT